PALLVSLGIRAPVAPTTTYFEAQAQRDSEGESTQPALPILVVPAMGALDSIVAGLERSSTIRVPAGATHVASIRALAKRGVALFTRDAPSVHTSPEGVVALNLLRSCTSWPAGVWIDAPTRKLPDGAPFETMHGSHRFEYALYAHAGDWREGRVPERAHEDDGDGVGPATTSRAVVGLAFFVRVHPPGGQPEAL